jgi:hypothetical protein
MSRGSGGKVDYEQIAAILGSAAYARASAALIAGFEDCDEFCPLMERQKATLLENLVAHFQSLETEFGELMHAASMLAPSLVADLDAATRARPRRSD